MGQMDEECLRSIQESKTLAGIFQSVVEDCKSLHPAIDDFVIKSGKLESHLQTTIFAFSAFMESFKKIAYKASNTKGSSRDIGACLMNVSMKQKEIETQLKTFSNSLSNGICINLRCKNEESKKKLKFLEKNHMKDFKLLRSCIKRKIETIHRLRKKMSKENSSEIQKQIECNTTELYTEYRVLEKQERQAVRRINMEERNQFCDFAACVKQVVIEEVALLKEIGSVKEVLENMNKITDDPHKIPDTADKVINAILETGNIYSFDTPTSSTNSSIRGSRCGSLRSISSLVNSRSNSPHCSSEENHIRIRRERSGSIRSCSDSPQTRLSWISLPCQQNSDDDSTVLSSSHPTQSPFIRKSRPNSTCEMYSRGREPSSSPSVLARDDNQTYSTIRRAHSPFRMPTGHESAFDHRSAVSAARRPPLQRKHKPADRPPIPPRSDSIDRVNTYAQHCDTAWPSIQGGEGTRLSSTSACTLPRCLQSLSLAQFSQGQKEIVLPQSNCVPGEEGTSDNEETEEDVETPTGENIFPSSKI